MLHHLVQSIVERLESLLLTKQFDQLGALQLDRELRALAKRLSELSNRSARESLARLKDITALLNVEAESEVCGLWEEGGWRLSAAEAMHILSLRVEFRKDVLANLNLR